MDQSPNVSEQDTVLAPANDPPPGPLPTQPSLNEEVTQVLGSLKGFWGGFRRQSQTAFESARKDFGSVVIQAQREIGRLSSELQQPAPPSTASSDELQASTSADVPVSIEENSEPPTQSLFSMIKSSLPPALASAPSSFQTTIQKHLPPADMNQLRNALATNVKRVQDGVNTTIIPSLSQAEKFAEPYFQKSETLLKEYGEFLKDAIQIIPPSPEDGRRSPGLVWDGSDVWMFGDGGKEKEVIFEAGGSRRARGPVLRRAEALLKQLRNDPAILKMDPHVDANEIYAKWIEEEVDPKAGVINGEFWNERRLATLKEDDEALKATLNALVPETIDEETFWQRYFFRVYQIEKQEERRKALLEASNETEEDFSWDDEDDAEGTPQHNRHTPESRTPRASASASSSTTLPTDPDLLKTPQVAVAPPQAPESSTSPRVSEDSYDLVSSRSGNGSSTGLSAPASRAPGKDGDEDPDSDWE